MPRYFVPAAALVCGVIMILSCNSSLKEKSTADSTAASSPAADSTVFRFRDQQQIEKVILGFCENFDNGDLLKCVEFMADSIHGKIDGVRLDGKQNWTAKIDGLLKSTKGSHFQPRHMITNMQFFPGVHDTVKVSMYAACLWTDLTSGQIQLMSIGYYKGKVVLENRKWLIAVLNSLPDSRLVKQFYQDVRVDSVSAVSQ